MAGPTVTVTIRLHSDLVKKVDRIARQETRTRNRQIQRWVEQAIAEADAPAVAG